MEQTPPTILDEAARLTSQDRNRHYGHPRDNFGSIALGLTGYLRAARKLAPGAEISPRDVAWCMVITKVMRDGNMPQRDNLVDAAGYVRCVERLQEPVDESIEEMIDAAAAESVDVPGEEFFPPPAGDGGGISWTGQHLCPNCVHAQKCSIRRDYPAGAPILDCASFVDTSKS